MTTHSTNLTAKKKISCSTVGLHKWSSATSLQKLASRCPLRHPSMETMSNDNNNNEMILTSLLDSFDYVFGDRQTHLSGMRLDSVVSDGVMNSELSSQKKMGESKVKGKKAVSKQVKGNTSLKADQSKQKAVVADDGDVIHNEKKGYHLDIAKARRSDAFRVRSTGSNDCVAVARRATSHYEAAQAFHKAGLSLFGTPWEGQNTSMSTHFEWCFCI